MERFLMRSAFESYLRKKTRKTWTQDSLKELWDLYRQDSAHFIEKRGRVLCIIARVMIPGLNANPRFTEGVTFYNLTNSRFASGLAALRIGSTPELVCGGVKPGRARLLRKFPGLNVQYYTATFSVVDSRTLRQAA